MHIRKKNTRTSGFTLTEVMVAAAAFSIFASALLINWAALMTESLNTIEYCQTENDQMRAMDYLKRDIRRATSIAIYNGATLVTGNNNYGTTLQITLPKYYSDSNPEDDAIGPRVAYTPTLSGSTVTYGTPFTVQYYSLNGAIIHNEGGTTRTVSDGGATYALSFCYDPSGLIHCRVNYTQTMRSGKSRQLARQVDMLCAQRANLF